MDSSNFVKNLTSKDMELSHKTLKALIESASIENFNTLVEKSEFIFPFLKERICSDFVKLLNKENLNCVFEFSKVYSDDFSDMIINSWVKFASEDLTDEILELFENGTQEQKAYCALYFNRIQDPLALEYLNKYAFCDYSPLKINCAKTLSTFKDTEALNKAMNEVLETEDEFEKLNLYEFICAYKSDTALNFTLDNCFECDFYENIILNLLDTYDFEYLKNKIPPEKINRILQVLLEGLPEDISLTTISYYQIFDYIRFVAKEPKNHNQALILKAKKDFIEYLKNDIYNYDLDKNTKAELSKIVEFLNSIQFEINLSSELENIDKPYRFNLALNVIKDYDIKKYSNEIAELINLNKLPESLLAQSIMTLKALGTIDLVQKDVIEKINNENIKAIVMDCFK